MPRSRSAKLSHVDSEGRIRMVDVGDKPVTAREAVARGTVMMSPTARRLVQSGKNKKGDPLQAARLAGIMAAKRTSELIPLCHPLPLTHVSVDITPAPGGFAIDARARTSGQTGVEMEALTAIAVAALTLYDMVKAVDKGMVIGDICLLEKRGGKSGDYTRDQGSGIRDQFRGNAKGENQKPKTTKTKSNPKQENQNKTNTQHNKTHDNTGSRTGDPHEASPTTPTVQGELKRGKRHKANDTRTAQGEGKGKRLNAGR
jgi:cyclic pyranopterin phosphate synthase